MKVATHKFHKFWVPNFQKWQRKAGKDDDEISKLTKKALRKF